MVILKRNIVRNEEILVLRGLFKNGAVSLVRLFLGCFYISLECYVR